MPEYDGKVIIDDEVFDMTEKRYVIIPKDKKVVVEYQVLDEYKPEDVFLTLLSLESYERYMAAIGDSMYDIKTNTSPTTILEAKVNVDEHHDYLFTSIEYERGMRVYVDGKEIEPDIVLDALVGIPMDEGEHEIKITYIPRGLVPGAIVSILALGSAVFYLQRRKKVI